jgi:hypothetical protein
MTTENRLTDEQIRLLKDWCARTGKTVEELLADAQARFEPARSNGPSRDTLLERMARKGLVGCLTGGPPDLSTNEDHMKGFGE